MTEADAIIMAVAATFDLREADLRGPRRLPKITRGRQAAYWLLRVLPDVDGAIRSFVTVARALGRSDHSTSFLGYWQAEEKLTRDADFTGRLAAAGALLAAREDVGLNLPPDIRTPVGTFRHVKPRNEVARGDTDARKRLHGTAALGRALLAAGGHR